MKKKLSIIFALLILGIPGFGQFKGLVVDAETKEPIPYVSIGQPGSGRGTISNELGEFIIEASGLSSEFVFSHISFQKDTVIVPKDSLVTIELHKTAVILNELIVEGGDYVASLLANAHQKLMDEYDSVHFGETFYRQITMIDGKPTEVQEIFYNTNMNSAGLLGASLKTGRYAAKEAIASSTNFSVLFKRFSLIKNYKGSPTGGHIYLMDNSKTSYQLNRIFRNGASEIAEVAFNCQEGKCNGTVHGVVYIDTQTYEIRSYSVTLGSVPRKKSGEQLKLTYIINFAGTKDKYQIDFIKVDLNHKIKKRFKYHPVHVSSLTYFYATKSSPSDVEYQLAGSGLSDREAIESKPYDPEFWKKHPVVQRTPLEEGIIQAFESKGSFGNMVRK